MNKINTLKNKVIQLGKFGFWVTAFLILYSLLFQVSAQISIWSDVPNWLIFDDAFKAWKGGFTIEELNKADQRGKKIVAVVKCAHFLLSSAISLTLLFIFRSMWQGQAIAQRTATLVMVLGILCILEMMIIIDCPRIPLDERSGESVGMLEFGISLPLSWEIAFCLIAIAASRIISFANMQECQLKDIV